MRFAMMMKTIRDYLAPPVSETEAEIERARARNAKAAKTMHDIRSSINKALAEVKATRKNDAPNGAEGVPR